MISSPTALWHSMSRERDQYLERARVSAQLTIPSLFPYTEGLMGGQIPVPFQSTGAEGVKHLASSLVLSLMPMDFPFFRFDHGIDTKKLPSRQKAVLDGLMAELEQATLRAMEEMRVRTVLFEALEYTLVGGGAVLDFRRSSPRCHRFHNYCMRRDGRGSLALLLVRESPSVDDMREHFETYGSDEIVAAFSEEMKDTSSGGHAALYTVVERVADDKFESYQFICGPRSERSRTGGLLVPETFETYTAKKPLPWIVFGYKWLDQENYPRSYCDELIGDLDYLNELSRAFIEASAAASKMNPMVDPAGMTELDDIIEAQNLEPIPGREKDVSILSFESSLSGLSAMAAQIQVRQQDLQRQFLMFLGARRDGERVTAVEIHQTALELEKGLGGFYSRLSEQFQGPLVGLVLDRVLKDKRNATLLESLRSLGVTMTPKVTAGLDILSRGQALNRFSFAWQTALAMIPPEIATQYLKVDEALSFIFSNAGIPNPPFIRSEEEVQQLQAQATQQQALIQSAPKLVDAAVQQQQQ